MKKFNFYEPIFEPIGTEYDVWILLLMLYGCTEEEAKEKIANGWRPPFEDEDEDYD